MHGQRRAVIMLVFTAFLWSLAGPLIKSIDWNPMAIAAVRSGIATLMLAGIVKRENFTGSLPQLGGAIAYAITVLLFVVANKWTTAANAILLQYTAPLWIGICGAWYLKERPSRFDWTVIVLLLAGMSLFFLDRISFQATWGNVFATMTGCSWAWLTLFLRKQRHGSPVETIFLGNLLAAAIGLPFCLGSVPRADGGVWLAVLLLLLLGVFQMGLSYLLYARAIRHVTAVEAILILAIEPVLNPLMVLVLHGEKPGPWALAGGSLVLACFAVRAAAAWRRASALVAATRRHSRREEDPL